MRDTICSDRKLGWMDLSLAALVGIVCSGAIFFLGVPGIDPSLWDEVAIVAGIRPPRMIFPGFWRLVADWHFSIFGISGIVGWLSVCGAIVSGVCVALFYLIVRHLLAFLIRTEKNYRIWSVFIAPFAAGVAAMLFGLSEPFWRISRVFTPELLRLFAFLLIVFVACRWFVLGGRWRLFPAFALMGFLAAETPFAFLMPVVFVLCYILFWHGVVNEVYVRPENLPGPRMMPKWRMFFLFLGGLALGVWINASTFVSLGGLAANGWRANDIYFRYAVGYCYAFSSSASVIGWMLGLGFCVLPFIVSVRVFTMVARDDRPMPFGRGVLLFFAGIVATMQSSAFLVTRFWVFSKETVLVPDVFLLTFFVFCAMATVAFFMAAFAFECQRTYLNSNDRQPGILLKNLVPALALILLFAALCRIGKPVESEMQRIVDDAVEEIVDECGDAQWLFTDGRLDSAIELVAATKGRTLRTLNMMSGASPWEIFIRKRGFPPESADCKSAETGVPALLRVWAGEKPGGMDNAALQLGFEFWKRENKKLPRASGLIAREKGLSDADVEKGVARATGLAKRILALSPRIEKASPSPALASALSAVNWRISRFARLRNEEQLANDLDLTNGALKRMLSIIEYERLRTFMQLTPREGLQLALRRADFTEARRYSAAVLRYDEDDQEANFGMGMSALSRNNMKDAEFYLKRVLKRRPNEPAVLNNLSIICRKRSRFEEALDYAQKAIKVMPESPEIKQTLADALKKAP